MEKRFANFLLLSALILFGSLWLQATLFPPKPADDEQAALLADADGDADADGGPAAVAEVSGADMSDADRDAQADANPADNGGADAAAPKPAVLPARVVTMGSLDPASPYRMLVTANTRGAVIDRIELNNPRYTDLDGDHGYLGELALKSENDGCRVGVVGNGTPAARATCTGDATQNGLRGPVYHRSESGEVTIAEEGDLITALNGRAASDPSTLRALLEEFRPGDEITLTVRRGSRELEFAVELGEIPLSLVSPERLTFGESRDHEQDATDPSSFLMGITRLGAKAASFDQDELNAAPSLRTGNWDVHVVRANTDADPAAMDVVEFSRVITVPAQADGDPPQQLKFIKRFKLATTADVENRSSEANAYHLEMEIEVENLSASAAKFAYSLDGPTGLPLEGWWYANKVHPRRFQAAGLRDVIWRDSHSAHTMITGPELVKLAKKGDTDSPEKRLVEPESDTLMRYVGVDAQYFACVMMSGATDDPDDKFGRVENYRLESALARAVGPIDLKIRKRTNVSFRLNSMNINLPAQETFRQRFAIYAGPKDPDVLEQYGLSDCIVYGWFGVVSKLLLRILHFFHDYVIFNYGLAIILLTVLVRGCLFPFGRKMARNAQKMQELAPEMKKINDKYKDDIEKRTEAQRELWAKHNYNPMGGCFLMFFQVPIFIGLYRALSVDIALRKAPLIPGIRWCSNLAGPDKFWYWRDWIPFHNVVDETGWLGPYLNILPLITVGLFVIHQKLFTPPATDDSQKMQQQMMSVMMVFMGVMFHKVAAGLCIYFIASSLWGLGERLLLPKSKPGEQRKESKSLLSSLMAATTSNGNEESLEDKRKRRKRAKGRN
ncbi:MAG: membrane protein insertase YidC [Pirellulaceae bacterium]